MNFSERQEDILAMIRTNGRVEVEKLASVYGITTQTIR
ncbi:MAG TPA: DeoR family transcriptional regulator, partial [Devosia sp.]|nr:DeoR family transcriptional regulator [Devosia sp.]